MADEDLIARADSLMGRRRSFMPSAPAEPEEDLPRGWHMGAAQPLACRNPEQMLVKHHAGERHQGGDETSRDPRQTGENQHETAAFRHETPREILQGGALPGE